MLAIVHIATKLDVSNGDQIWMMSYTQCCVDMSQIDFQKLRQLWLKEPSVRIILL